MPRTHTQEHVHLFICDLSSPAYPNMLIYLPLLPSLCPLVSSISSSVNFVKAQHLLKLCFDSSTLKVISVDRGDDGVALFDRK